MSNPKKLYKVIGLDRVQTNKDGSKSNVYKVSYTYDKPVKVSKLEKK